MNEAIKMQISAFVDGELPDSEADLLLRRMSQDAELRREAADYLELGRIMRGEYSARGVEYLRERIAAAIDENKVVEEGEVGPELQPGKALRPLVGVAVAASVALVALFGLQMTPGVDSQVPVGDTVAESIEDSGYSTPERLDRQILQYVDRHGAASTELGANGMRARLTSLRRSEEIPVDEATDDETDSEETTVNDSPTQP